MGIVCVLIVRTDDEVEIIAAFVTSCSVFGYGLETAILDRVRAGSLGRPVSGKIIETQSNGPCRNAYEEHGFKIEDGVWILRQSNLLEIKPWLTVVEI